MKFSGWVSAVFMALGVSAACAANANAAQLITNGDFETGSLAGWTTVGTGCCSNNFYLIGNGANAPASGLPTQVNPAGGNYAAVSDQYGTGGEALLQSFTTPGGPLTLKFDWFDNDHNGQFGTAIDGSEQTGRVDILGASASPFDVGSGVVQNLLLGAGTYTPYGATIPWQSASFTITGLAAGTYQLRFGNGQCCYFQEFGVDNVSLTSSVPEPGVWTMLLVGFGGLGVAMRARRKPATAVA